VLKTILISLITLAITSTANGQAQKNWKDRTEYELYAAVLGEGTPASRLQNLDKWKSQYPQSDYTDTRLKMYLLTYQQMNNHRAAFDAATEILTSQPNDLLALKEIIDHGLQLLPEQPSSSFSTENKSNLDTIQKTGRYVLEHLDMIYAANKKPQRMSAQEWSSAKTEMQGSARTVVDRGQFR
jgi:hypothetical protein